MFRGLINFEPFLTVSKIHNRRNIFGPFTFPAFCFESCTALALNHFCHLTFSAYARLAYAITNFSFEKWLFDFNIHSWWYDFDFNSYIRDRRTVRPDQIGPYILPYFIITAVCASFISCSLAPSNGSHNQNWFTALWTTPNCSLGQNYSAFPN